MITEKQKNEIINLWYEYGNNSPKCTTRYHKFIQGFLENVEDRMSRNKCNSMLQFYEKMRVFYKLSKKDIVAEKILQIIDDIPK